MSDPAELRKKSRRRIVQENNGDPSLTDLGDGYFALHIQYGGNAVVVNVGTGTEDQAAFREWVEFVVARLMPSRLSR